MTLVPISEQSCGSESCSCEPRECRNLNMMLQGAVPKMKQPSLFHEEDLNEFAWLQPQPQPVALDRSSREATAWKQNDSSEIADVTNISHTVLDHGRCESEAADAAQPDEPISSTFDEHSCARESRSTCNTAVDEIFTASVTERSRSVRRSVGWQAKVDELSRRAVALEDLFGFYQRLGTENGPMPHFDPLCNTTNDVVRSAIIPESRERCCALATVFNDGQPKMPQKMVTHHWSNRFSHTVAAIVADALDLSSYDRVAQSLADRASCEQLKEELRNKSKLSLCYWLCAVSVNQHCSICDSNGRGTAERDSVTKCIIHFCGCGLPKHVVGDDCEMNKFIEMMSLLCNKVPSFGQVIAVDGNFDMFSRAWCVAEIVEARQKKMPQYLKIHSAASLKDHREIVKCLDVRDCRASRTEDKEAILAGIENIDAFNDYLNELLLGRHNGLLVETFQLLAGYTLWWDGLSNDYLLQLSQNEHHTVPLCLFTLVPTLISLFFTTFPLGSPEQTWQDQSFFFYIYLPLFTVTCVAYSPLWLLKNTGIQYNRVVCVKILLWIAGCATSLPCTVFCCAVAIDIFPIPWTPVLMATGAFTLQPLMYFCAPAHERCDSRFRWRLYHGMTACAALLLVFAMLFKVLTFAIKNVHTIWQMAIVVVFLASKLLFEHLGRLLARRNTADCMPSFIFMASYSYELNMCIIFCGGFDWLVFVELVSFDAIENLFHLWSLARDRHHPLEAPSSQADTGTIQISGTLQQHSSMQVYIVSVLVMREFVEVIVPIQFLAVFSLVRLTEPRFIDIVCDMSDAQFRQAQIFLVTDICVELVLASITYAVLKYHGFRPWYLLRSLVSTEFYIMVPFASTALTYLLCGHHSHFGQDMTLTFPWLQNDHAKWHCGLKWH